MQNDTDQWNARRATGTAPVNGDGQGRDENRVGSGVSGHKRFADAEYREDARFQSAVITYLATVEEIARARGVGGHQLLMLIAIRGHSKYPCLSIGDVAGAMKVKVATGSYLVEQGVRDGHVLRTEDPDDRRRALVRLSPSGQRVLDEVLAAIQLELDQLQKPRTHRSEVDDVA
jgi:DNA-binding MarR family transcriptional regulator